MLQRRCLLALRFMLLLAINPYWSGAQEVRAPARPNQIPEVGPPVVLPLPSPTKQTSNPNPGTEYVRVTVDAVPGPYGLAVYQSGGTGVAGANPAPPSSYNYPSIVLLISATPLLTPKLKDANNLESIKDVNGDNDVEWMDITFDLKAFDASNNEAKCTGPCFQIIGLLPGTTTAASKAQAPATIADTAQKAAAAIAPAIPVGGSILTAATTGAQVIFDALFPPKTVTYQYAYLDNSGTTFGWYFKPNPNATPPTSVLGVQIGQVMLQTDPSVKSIEVTSRALSRWQKAPSSFSNNFIYSTSETTIPVQSNAINYSTLQNLDLFPALIAKDAVEKILNITDVQYNTLTTGTPAILASTPDHSLVMKSSLLKYITP